MSRYEAVAAGPLRHRARGALGAARAQRRARALPRHRPRDQRERRDALRRAARGGADGQPPQGARGRGQARGGGGVRAAHRRWSPTRCRASRRPRMRWRVADVRAATAKLARDLDLVFPQVVDEPRLELMRARHLLLALDLTGVVPSDLSIEAGRAMVVSGPNAGGKTVALKTMGLAALHGAGGYPGAVRRRQRRGSLRRRPHGRGRRPESPEEPLDLQRAREEPRGDPGRDDSGGAGPARRARRRDRSARGRGARGRRAR